MLSVVHQRENKSFPPTCEEAAVLLLYFLCRLILLLGMFLWQFIPQVQRVLLLSEETTSAPVSCLENLIHTQIHNIVQYHGLEGVKSL